MSTHGISEQLGYMDGFETYLYTAPVIDVALDTIEGRVTDLEDNTSNIDNTSDLDKPMSNAVTTAMSDIATAMETKADLVSGKVPTTQLPEIPAVQVQSDWNAVSGISQVLNKPTLFDGVYSSLTSKPSLSTVATSGSYSDLSNKPTIPTARRIETYLGSTNASGDYTVTYATPFTTTPDVQPQLQAPTDTQTVRITASTTTGFTVKARNRADVIGLLPSYSNLASASVSVLVTAR